MKRITIIGAGLSGTLLAFNLLQKSAKQNVKIQLIDRNPPEFLGPAYSSDESYLLNVPVEMMGALPRDPEHFLKWLCKRNIVARHGDYMPRKIYRQYIQSLLNKAVLNKDRNTEYERIQNEVIDLDFTKNREWILKTDNGNICTDILILALGNSPPKNPRIKNVSFYDHPHYVRNPWDRGILNSLYEQDHILFIGCGQTMVDLISGLYKRKYKGRMTAISRRGLLPLEQKKTTAYPGFYDELSKETRIASIFRIVRKHMALAREKNLDIRSVIDSLRPHTIQIWMNLPVAEKKRFLRHVFRYWEIIRSRIPPESKRIIEEMQVSGQLNILTGRIIDFVMENNKIIMQYRVRRSQKEKTMAFDWVVNCIGPDQDYETIDSPLIQNLIRKKWIHCDPVHLGINALPDGSVIGNDETISDDLFTIGLTLKGIVWEALAAPEIRVQAENLADKILKLK
jgi:uncharacterized NAD(P)/FAD-binding protein YdhS